MQKKYLSVVGSILLLFLFTTHELILNSSPDSLLQLCVLKFLLSIIPVILSFYGLTTSKNEMIKHITTALFVYLLGDVFINIRFEAGELFFFIGNIYFAFNFYRYKKPSAVQYILWIFVSLIVVAGLCFIDRSLQDKILGGFYLSSMLLMVVFSFSTPRLLNIGAVIFGLSDLLLVYNLIATETVLSHILSLGAYYAGIMIIAYAALYSEKHIIKPNI